VGGAYLLRGSALQAGVFIVVMLTTLALSKFAVAKSIALLGARFERQVQDRIMKILAVLLLAFAVRLLLQGWHSIAG
jgi:threonine/homoserine/homoserine lactone efflux protein